MLDSSQKLRDSENFLEHLQIGSQTQDEFEQLRKRTGAINPTGSRGGMEDSEKLRRVVDNMGRRPVKDSDLSTEEIDSDLEKLNKQREERIRNLQGTKDEDDRKHALMVARMGRNTKKEDQKRKNARETIKKYNTGKYKGRAKNTIKDTKKMLESLSTPLGFLATILQANPISDWMYGLALMAAILKDLLDLTETSGFLYGAIVVITFLISIFIAMMMLLGSFSDGSSKNNRIDRKIIRSWLTLVAGTTIEMLFGINLLPIETFTVLIIYFFVLSERRQNKEAEKKARYSEQAQ